MGRLGPAQGWPRVITPVLPLPLELTPALSPLPTGTVMPIDGKLEAQRQGGSSRPRSSGRRLLLAQRAGRSP